MRNTTTKVMPKMSAYITRHFSSGQNKRGERQYCTDVLKKFFLIDISLPMLSFLPDFFFTIPGLGSLEIHVANKILAISLFITTLRYHPFHWLMETLTAMVVLVITVRWVPLILALRFGIWTF